MSRMPTTELLAELPDELRKHHQFPGDFCAVSDFESLAKLEGLLDPAAFPLQMNVTNQRKGFEPAHRGYLEGIGLEVDDKHYDSGAGAAAVIAAEVAAGRSVLMAMPHLENPIGKHVYVFTKYKGDTILVDPAEPRVKLRGMDAIPTVLENWRANSPHPEKTIHLLTYRRR
jgi:hypothetical protein